VETGPVLVAAERNDSPAGVLFWRRKTAEDFAVRDRMQRRAYAAATLSLACALSHGHSAAWAQPQRPGPVFDDRFQIGAPIAPIFTRPAVAQQLSALTPSQADPMNAISVADEPTRPSRRIAFAQPKGPTKVLKDLLNTPVMDLLVPKAEAGDEDSKAAQESAPTHAPTVPMTAAVSPRAADPVAERPAAEDNVSTAGSGAAGPTATQDQSAPRPPSDFALVLPPDPTPPQISAPETTASTGTPAPAAHAEPSDQAAVRLPDEHASETRTGERRIDRTGSATGQRVGRGYASWYQHPGRTASGEPFNPDQLTAAHRTLPFGAYVRVVDERSRRSVVVRVNDRIPTKATIAIDLSRASARAIGLTGRTQVSLYEADPAATTGSVRPASELLRVREARCVRPLLTPCL
jgi:rare lipoprotein A